MKNAVLLREHADITGCDIVLPKEPEAVLLGSAVLGAVAGGFHFSVLAAMNVMNASGEIIKPSERPRGYHGPETPGVPSDAFGFYELPPDHESGLLEGLKS